MSIIGVDEAGRGAWAGPLVAAAVVIERPEVFPFRFVRDSKLLSDSQRRRLFAHILYACRVAYGIVSHRLIDRIGIQAANVLAVDRALHRIPDGAYDIHSDYIASFAKLTSLEVPVTLHINGESVLAEIAAASIAAKVLRDDLMNRFSVNFPKYHFDAHKGYGTNGHMRAIRAWGRSPLHRESFRF